MFEGEKSMNRHDFDLLMFYCWQLKLYTLGELAYVKNFFNITSNKALLEKLAELYNGEYYNDLYND